MKADKPTRPMKTHGQMNLSTARILVLMRMP